MYLNFDLFVCEHNLNYLLAFSVAGGAFEVVEDQISPFGYKKGEGIDAGSNEPEWIIMKEKYKYDALFETLGPSDGKITGAGVYTELLLLFFFNQINLYIFLWKYLNDFKINDE